jgi:hypothetical protein
MVDVDHRKDPHTFNRGVTAAVAAVIALTISSETICYIMPDDAVDTQLIGSPLVCLESLESA